MSDDGPSRPPIIRDEEQNDPAGMDSNGHVDEENTSGGEVAGNGVHLSNDSPLSRAGLLQPRSFGPSSFSRPRSLSPKSHLYSYTSDDIREGTINISSVVVSARPSVDASRQDVPGPSTRKLESTSAQSRDSFLFPSAPESGDEGHSALEKISDVDSEALSLSDMHSSQITSTNSFREHATSKDFHRRDIEAQSGTSTPRGGAQRAISPSGLTILIARQRKEVTSGESSEAATLTSPRLTRFPEPERQAFVPAMPLAVASTKLAAIASAEDVSTLLPQHFIEPTETTPLYPDRESTTMGYSSAGGAHDANKCSRAIAKMRSFAKPHVLSHFLASIVSSLPAVLLGCLLNILDGVSYGMIMFPSNDVFPDFGGIGVSMFFVTTIISQFTYSLGGSSFTGANGSMMIEVVPFFHMLAARITQIIGEDHPSEIISTTVVAYAFSAILTGLSFFLLGALKLGVIIGFFPRHILVGCIGGVGVFLIRTGLTVCARMDDDDFAYTFDTLKYFIQPHILALWLPAFALAVLLRLITHKFHHQLIFPIYFIMISLLFYVVVLSARINLTNLRKDGWIFDMGSTSEPWYTFYSYYNFKLVSFKALWLTLPTQFALLFFNILHPPLNVPALAVSLNEDVDTNKELVAHGYSNFIAGVLGTAPNYLVYVNTLLFYRVGGASRMAGFLLAIFTSFLLIAGTAPIGYIPIMVVGALIFVLGIDLIKEALWDTRHRANRSEYITILSIMICMTLWDFVIGVLFGIVVCCFFFVVQNSRARCIRAMYSGEHAMSAVRRPSAHRAYIREVSKQTTILKLQGFLFFGTITYVEEAIRKLVDFDSWQQNPIRFLVIDLSLVAGVDMSSAEAFVRVQRLLADRDVIMVLCGFHANSPIATSLGSVGLFETERVEIFATLSDAMEWTENAYLRAWFLSQKAERDISARYVALPGPHKPAFLLSESFSGSPRRTQVQVAANRTIAQDHVSFATSTDDPFVTLTKALSSYGNLDRELFQPLLLVLKRMSIPEGVTLWRQGDDPDGLYFVESGALRASYSFTDHDEGIQESMVGGTLAGELSALANLPRNATVVVERQAVLWKLSLDDLREVEERHPLLARTFLKLVLKAAKIDYDILLSALATRQ